MAKDPNKKGTKYGNNQSPNGEDALPLLSLFQEVTIFSNCNNYIVVKFIFLE